MSIADFRLLYYRKSSKAPTMSSLFPIPYCTYGYLPAFDALIFSIFLSYMKQQGAIIMDENSSPVGIVHVDISSLVFQDEVEARQIDDNIVQKLINIFTMSSNGCERD